MNFNLGNSVKYIWRCGDKGKTTEDINKAIWYLKQELKRLNPVIKVNTEGQEPTWDLLIRQVNGG